MGPCFLQRCARPDVQALEEMDSLLWHRRWSYLNVDDRNPLGALWRDIYDELVASLRPALVGLEIWQFARLRPPLGSYPVRVKSDDGRLGLTRAVPNVHPFHHRDDFSSGRKRQRIEELELVEGRRYGRACVAGGSSWSCYRCDLRRPGNRRLRRPSWGDRGAGRRLSHACDCGQGWGWPGNLRLEAGHFGAQRGAVIAPAGSRPQTGEHNHQRKDPVRFHTTRPRRANFTAVKSSRTIPGPSPYGNHPQRRLATAHRAWRGGGVLATGQSTAEIAATPARPPQSRSAGKRRQKRRAGKPPPAS